MPREHVHLPIGLHGPGVAQVEGGFVVCGGRKQGYWGVINLNKMVRYMATEEHTTESFIPVSSVGFGASKKGCTSPCL